MAFACCSRAQVAHFPIDTETIRGAAIDSARAHIYTWGDRLREWDSEKLNSRVLAEGPFGEGGCVADMNGDGAEDLVLVEGSGLGTLVWLEAPRWKRHVLDTEVEMHDCRAAALFGRRGLLMVHRFMQVRFYSEGGVQDVYSFYTASEQAGLLLSDIDGDGRQDIVSGNYWIRCPESFDEPWRLFAINVMHQTPLSARFRLAMVEPADGLIAAQGEMDKAEVVLFRKPENPREQWPAVPLASNVKWHYPHGLAAADLSGSGRKDVVVGENNGAGSRLFVFRNLGSGGFERLDGPPGIPSLAIFAGKGRLTVVGPHALLRLSYPATFREFRSTEGPPN